MIFLQPHNSSFFYCIEPTGIVAVVSHREFESLSETSLVTSRSWETSLAITKPCQQIRFAGMIFKSAWLFQLAITKPCEMIRHSKGLSARMSY
jgi:hypothetical protein